MADCLLPVRPDMYGLGIRIAFYIQWFGFILLDCFAADELADVRLLGLFLSGAATLGLIIQLADDNLNAADIAIVLLLAVGYFIFYIPIYIWRAFTCCNPHWDPLRHTKERQIPFIRFLAFLLLIAVAGVGIWFNTNFLQRDDRPPCTQYGFFFGRLSLYGSAYTVINSIIYILIVVVCAGIFLVSLGWFPIRVVARTKRKRKVRYVSARPQYSI